MKKHLVCIDSDGCAIDSMEIKHRQCFGPYIIEVWHLEQWAEEILNRWNEINLYSKNRGINRFLGLEKILSEINDLYCEIEGVDKYSEWCKTTDTYSNAAISVKIQEDAHPIFAKVLEWSNLVNAGVAEISEMCRPFVGVKETINKIHQHADIAIVSSANPQAVHEEWTRFGLIDMVDYVMAQDVGTKADCIHILLEKGYDKENTMMVGDAPGDYDAAKTNGVQYYPIVPGSEVESWNRLSDEIIDIFLKNIYAGDNMKKMIEKFEKSLS